MRSSLHLLSLPTPHESRASSDDVELDDAMTAGLQRLNRACHTRRHADLKLETSSCKLGAVLAKMVADAALLNLRLPRDYVARINCGEAYLVKCAPDSDEVAFMLARRESTFARMEPRARDLSNAQILEFMRDVEDGLIHEIADFVERCNHSDEHAARCLERVLRMCDDSPLPRASHDVAAHDTPKLLDGDARSPRALPARRARRSIAKPLQQDKLPLSA